MDELFEKSKKLVKENIECDEELIEILAVAVLAILLLKEEQGIKKLPYILQSLRVSYNEGFDQEQERKSNHNYAVIYTDTCFKKDTIKEVKQLLIKKNTGYQTGLIQELIHELLKEMRTFQTRYGEDFLERRIGIAVERIGIYDNESHKKNEVIEDALEEFESKKAFEMLYEYLDKSELDSKVIEKLLQERNGECLYTYSIYTHFLEQIMNDKILQKTFLNPEVEKEVKTGIYYYNTMMEDDDAFSKLNRLFSKLKEAVLKKNLENIEKYIKQIQEELDAFNKKPKKYRLK